MTVGEIAGPGIRAESGEPSEPLEA